MPATTRIKHLLKEIKQKARQEQKENRRFFKRVKKKKPSGLDRAFKEQHDEAFKKINCMDCANCCRVALPVFETPDIRRIAPHLGMTPKEFIKKYLNKDPDYEYLTKKTPCPFIRDDNKCGIYEIRPQGCRTYPPARMRLTPDQLDVLHDNVDVCPAVNEMVDKIKKQFEV